MKTKLNLGKKEGTIGFGNDFWIKKFGNGVKLRKRGEAEITLDVAEVWEMLMYLRKYPKRHAFPIFKRHAFPIFLSAMDLTYVWQKYPETKEFVERLLTDEVSDKEKLKIHKEYMTKVNILKELEEK